MSEPAIRNGEEAIDESGRNPTQKRIDEEGASGAPVDADWQEKEEERMDDRIEGKVKEAEGKVTDDKGKEAEGKAQGGLGKAKDAAGDLGDAARDKLDE